MDHDEAAPAKWAGPLIATFVACFLIVGSNLSTSTNNAPLEGAFRYKNEAHFAGKIVGTFLSGLILWAICYAITIKRASRPVKVGSFALIMVLAIGIPLARTTSSHSAVADPKIRPDAQGRWPEIKGAPAHYTRIARVINNMVADDDIGFRAELAATGAAKLGELDVVSPSDPVLKDCGAIKRLAGRTGYYRQRWPLYVRTARDLGAQEVAAGAVDQKWVSGFLEGFDAKLRKTNFERRWDKEAQGLAMIHDVCVILARGHWEAKDGKIIFSNASDRAKVIALYAQAT